MAETKYSSMLGTEQYTHEPVRSVFETKKSEYAVYRRIYGTGRPELFSETNVWAQVGIYIWLVICFVLPAIFLLFGGL